MTPFVGLCRSPVQSQKDARLDSVEQHRREVLARTANSRLGIMPGSGHLIPVDEPAALAHAIDAFVAELKA